MGVADYSSFTGINQQLYNASVNFNWVKKREQFYWLVNIQIVHERTDGHYSNNYYIDWRTATKFFGISSFNNENYTI